MGKSTKTDIKKGSKTGKTSKSTKEKETELEKEKIESDSEIESENEEESDSEQENEDGQDEDQEEERDLDEPDSVEKKIQTFDTVFEDITQIRKDIASLESEKTKLINEHDKKISKIYADIKKERSKENKIITNILAKVHKKEVTQAKKERRKRNGENKGGFNKETEVPETLRKFLDLEEGTMLARPKVMSKLNAKFIELGLKKGQEVELDKKTAKKFGLKEGHVIGFTEFQRFIADQYPKTKSVDV